MHETEMTLASLCQQYIKSDLFALKLNLTTSVVLLTVHVLQEFWEVEELWDEFFDVSRALHASLPGSCY